MKLLLFIEKETEDKFMKNLKNKFLIILVCILTMHFGIFYNELNKFAYQPLFNQTQADAFKKWMKYQEDIRKRRKFPLPT